MNFLELNSIRISQPLSDFYIIKVKARDLLQMTFPEELTYIDKSGRLKGSQRKLDEKRLKVIARYIDSVEMAFPNSIVLAANYTIKGEVLDTESPDRWKIVDLKNDNYKIIIPTSKPLAAIIDGQHRLLSFKYVSNQERKDLELVCSIFFDLPNSYQAFLFATINGNQKKVDKSLALEQFGFNVEDEPQSSWTPEKLAVYFSRKLNADSNSPFYKHVKVAPKDDNFLLKNPDPNEWLISTATIVDGILSLISSQPKRDRVEMGQAHIFGSRSRKMVKNIEDNSPLRETYLQNEDDKIYKIISKYFSSVRRILWSNVLENSYIIKTVGVQALFDLLKKILQNISYDETTIFDNYLDVISNVNFTDNFFQASGVGRLRIRRILFLANNFITLENIKESEIDDMKRILNLK
jgi:DNA phosphorothioation-associated DGQHR protein 1